MVLQLAEHVLFVGGPLALGEGFVDGGGGGAVVRSVADGLHPAIGDFIAFRVAGGGSLEEGKGGRPVLPPDELAGLLEELVGFRLGMPARPAFEKPGDGLVHPAICQRRPCFWGRGEGRWTSRTDSQQAAALPQSSPASLSQRRPRWRISPTS